MNKTFILVFLLILMSGAVFAVNISSEMENVTAPNITQIRGINMSLNGTIISQRMYDRYLNMRNRMRNRSEREHEREIEDMREMRNRSEREHEREIEDMREMRNRSEREHDNEREMREFERWGMRHAFRVKTKLRLYKRIIRIREGNRSVNDSEWMVKLNNGRNSKIKIMPQNASAIALKRLRLKVCNKTVNNCTVELKEVSNGNTTQVVYEMRARKAFRLFRLFRMEREVSMEINAITGEELFVRRPWWSWFASEQAN